MTSPEDLLGRVRRRVLATPGGYDGAALAVALRDEAPTAGAGALLEAAGALMAEIGGAGVLEPLLQQPGVTDVLVNGPGPVWVDRGHGPQQTNIVLPDEAAVRRLAVRLVSAAGRRLDDASPYADARLTDGTRVHAVLPPLSPQGTCISLRVPPRRTFTLDDLLAAGSLPSAAVDLVRGLIQARVASWSPAARAAARPRFCRRCCRTPIAPSGSCWLRMPPSCAPTTLTSCGSRPARPTPRAWGP